MLKRLIRWLFRRFVQKIDRSAKCPACGCVHRHKIQWTQTYNKLIHSCAICHATWGADPVVSVDHWKILFASDTRTGVDGAHMKKEIAEILNPELASMEIMNDKQRVS